MTQYLRHDHAYCVCVYSRMHMIVQTSPKPSRAKLCFVTCVRNTKTSETEENPGSSQGRRTSRWRTPKVAFGVGLFGAEALGPPRRRCRRRRRRLFARSRRGRGGGLRGGGGQSHEGWYVRRAMLRLCLKGIVCFREEFRGSSSQNVRMD